MYLYTLKNDLFGCFIIEEIRDKTNETGLKEGRGVEMSTTVLPFTITIITTSIVTHNLLNFQFLKF